MSQHRHPGSKVFLFSIIAAALVTAWATVSLAARQTPYKPVLPLGLDAGAFYVPEDNPMTQEKIALGRLLFFDKRLSKNDTIACATCHMPSLAFTDGQPVSQGIHRQQGGRSAPMAVNRAFSKAQFWDGRAASVEDQALGPIINPIEHGFMDHDGLVAKLIKIAGYRKMFREAFGRDIMIEDMGKAIATFERTLLSGNSPFDRYELADEEDALSGEAQRGLELFRGKARCTKCHSGFNFSDEKFHNLGIGWDQGMVDVGRFAVTKETADLGAFKTPSLREITRTAPYMHDGRFASLEEVVNFYNQGGIKNPFQDSLIIPLDLTGQEKHDLVEFLHSLEGEGWQGIRPPAEFPM